MEVLLSGYSTSPQDVGQLRWLLNVLDPVRVPWLVHNLRQFVEGILDVNAVDLDRVLNLKASLWEGLHQFYEWQWKWLESWNLRIENLPVHQLEFWFYLFSNQFY